MRRPAKPEWRGPASWWRKLPRVAPVEAKKATCGIVCETSSSVNCRKGSAAQILWSYANSQIKCCAPNKHCPGELHAAFFVASDGFLLFCLRTFRFHLSASGTEKGRVVASQNARRIAKSHERRGGEKPRNRSGCGAGFEWATAMVRRYWQGGPGRKQGYCLRHRISRRFHQQNVCGAGAPEIGRRRKNQPLRTVAGRCAGNPREKPLGKYTSRAHCESSGAQRRV